MYETKLGTNQSLGLNSSEPTKSLSGVNEVVEDFGTASKFEEEPVLLLLIDRDVPMVEGFSSSSSPSWSLINSYSFVNSSSDWDVMISICFD
ncbi:hypothetical protein WICPIJ_002256 [Wickerhamomyces pijperi]|uniref:Uncharacterized protein n=1 Tax=Wickerhamomyces pijperi TaxID=599730 RepID=A0A9P8Q9C5_WICPI|nr:hypothetical protein WICPIJ_002256 [Wickerhamomyces pijperi]